MRQFDLVQIGRSSYALLLQADLLDSTNTQVVAPLIEVKSVKPTTKLHPLVEVKGRKYIVAVEKMSAVHRGEIKTVVGSMKDREWDVRRALDLVFVGV